MKLYQRKSSLVILLMLGMLSIATIAPAQNCEESFYRAGDAYYNGDYGQVHKWLRNCIREFDESRGHYINNNPDRVFKVYKLITSAYYQTDEDYKADEYVDRLISYFSGSLSAQQVVDKLYYTQI